jgi:RND family efflux transporter MFP subunit
MRFRFLLAGLFVLASACGHQDHSHEHGGEAHDHRDHGGHAHDEGGTDHPTVTITRWTDRTELFMEYPVLVVGETGRSAIHVTDLADFSPLDAGEVIVTLHPQHGKALEFRSGPSRPGVFGLDLHASRPGVYDMSLRVEAPGLQDLHELGQVEVHWPGETSGSEEEGGDGVSFLKEQQWRLDFGTVFAEERALRSSVTVPAVVRPRTGGEAVLAAPVPGRIDPSSTTPVPGARVRAGTILARIVPRLEDLRDAAALRAALIEAEQDHGLAVRDRDRVARLVEARALPARRLDQAEAALVASEARLDAARKRWNRFEASSETDDTGRTAGSISVRAPFEGFVSEVGFAPGGSVEENEVLLRLVDTDRTHVVGAVPESRGIDLHAVEGGEILRGSAAPIALSRPLSVGRVVEPLARTTEIRFPLDNRSAGFRIGENVRLRLFVGGEMHGTAIPESAVVEDAGRPIVFVQTGGETFERRLVDLGTRAGGWVQVREGVDPGERVVHRGAYLVRLAAMSTQIPAHGHVH